jgi:hypothetical protein
LRKFALIPPTKYNHWNFYIDMNEERGWADWDSWLALS